MSIRDGRSTDPDHGQMGWMEAYERCHFATEWRAVDFGHQALSLSCTICHLEEFQAAANPRHTHFGNFQVFSCLHCHWHDEDVELSRHEKVPGYTWVDSECVACHPTGH